MLLRLILIMLCPLCGLAGKKGDGVAEGISREEFDNLKEKVEFIDNQGTLGSRSAIKVHHDKAVFWSLLVIGVCFIAFAALNAWFVIWDVGTAQHVWCHVINTLNHAPAPKLQGAGAQSTPGRVYDEQLAQDFADLKKSLGC